jgi:transposase-like protein
LLGDDAAGLSPSAVSQLCGAWHEEYHRWRTRSLADRDYVYVWADGVRFNVRLDDERLAALVFIGAPVLVVGDGALGFWAAVGEVLPETKDQLCWVHKIANILDKLPKGIQPRAKQALHAMTYAETKAACDIEIDEFAEDYRAKDPKAVGSLVDNRERLFTFFAFPAEHWKHLRTTNPIESTSQRSSSASASPRALAHARPGSRWHSS